MRDDHISTLVHGANHFRSSLRVALLGTCFLCARQLLRMQVSRTHSMTYTTHVSLTQHSRSPAEQKRASGDQFCPSDQPFLTIHGFVKRLILLNNHSTVHSISVAARCQALVVTTSGSCGFLAVLVYRTRSPQYIHHPWAGDEPDGCSAGVNVCLVGFPTIQTDAPPPSRFCRQCARGTGPRTRPRTGRCCAPACWGGENKVGQA